ncbi:unnamed protein product, partial [Didymodactylos carnosus]
QTILVNQRNHHYQSKDESDAVIEHIETILISKINRWEHDMVQRIKSAANQARNTISSITHDYQNEIRNDFQQLTNEFEVKRAHDNYNERDLKQWNQKLDQIQQKVNNAVQIDTEQSQTINWSKMITVKWNGKTVTSTIKRMPLVLKQELSEYQQPVQQNQQQRVQPQTQQLHYFANLIIQKPHKIMRIKNEYGGLICASDNRILYQDTEETLCLIDYVCKNKQIIKWNKEDDIVDMCWLKLLDQFILLTKEYIFTVNPFDLQVHNSSKQIHSNEGEYKSCTNIDNILFLSFNRPNSPLEQWNIQDWKLINRWTKLFDKDDNVKCIRFLNKTQLALLIENRLEIRNCITMNIIRATKFIDVRTHGLVCLPTIQNYCLVINHSFHQDIAQSSNLLLIDDNGQKIKTIHYNEPIWSMIYFQDKNTFIIRTLNEMLFYTT